MKRNFLFLTLFMLALSWQTMAQVSIGSGSTVNVGAPVDPYYGYSYSQSIYLQNEIEGAGDITTLTWDFAGSSISSSNEWTIYIGHTTKSDFTSTTDWVDVSTLTQVFSGTVSLDANNKVVVDITDFTYNNTDNLIIAVDENTSGYDESSDDFNCFLTGSSDRALVYRNDSTDPDPASPPAGSVHTAVPNIILGGITTSVTAPECVGTPSPIDGAIDVDVESTGGQVTLSWVASTNGDVPTSYNVFWGTTSGSLTDLGATANTTVDITGVDMNTQYYWLIVPSNAGGLATGCAEWTFTTAAATMYCTPAPSSVDGNGMTNVTFSTVDNTTTVPATSPYYTDYTAMVGDVTAGGTENISITFETGYSYDTWVWIDWNDDFDFDDADEAQYLGNSSSDNPTTENWTFNVPASAPAGNHLMRIGSADSGLGSTDGNPCYTGSYGEFEDYTVNVIVPSCLPASNLVETSSTPNSITIGWDGNGAASWNVEYGLQGFTQGTGTSSTETSETFTASGLTNPTAYDFYVQSNCGGSTSDWVGPLTVTTPVPAPSNDLCANPITLTLDNGACGAGAIIGISNAGATDSGEAAPTCGNYSGGDLWYSVTIPTGVTDITLNTDNVDGLTSVAGALYSGTCGALVEEDCTEFGSGWPWEITGLAPGATYLLRVWDYSNDEVGTFDLCGYYITCPNPSAITVSNITQVGAEIAWTTGGANDWQVVVQPAGTGTPTSAGIDVSTNPYTAQGLLPSTDYEVYVRDNCGSGDLSGWVGPVSFTTECGVITPDYMQDFTNYLPACWTEGEGSLVDGPSGTSSEWTSDGFLNDGYTGSAKFNLYNANDEDWLISPEFDLSGAICTLDFDVAVTKYTGTDASGMGSDDEVQLLYTIDGGMTWNNMMTWDVNNTPSNTGDHHTISLVQASTVQFAYWANEGTTDDTEDYNFYIDNFSITAPAVCNAPTNVQAASITAVSAEITWTGSDAYEVSVVPSGDNAIAGTSGTSPYTASGLDACTDYDVYVRTDCGNGLYSDWTGPVAFTTASSLSSIDIADQSVCASATTVDLTALEPTGQTGGTWSLGGAAVGEPVAETVTDGNVYTYTLTDGNCTESDDVTYTVGSSITPTFTQVGTLCASDAPVNLPTTSTNSITGTWDVNPFDPASGTGTVTFTPDAGQCAETTTMTITVTPVVTPTFTQVGPLCASDAPVNLPTTSTNGITGTWDVNPFDPASGTGTVTFTPDGGQCAETTTMTITVTPVVTPTFTQVGPLDASDAPVNLPTTSTNGITGAWDVNPFDPANGTGTVTFTPDAGQCAETTTMTITVNSSSTCPGAGAIIITEIMKNPDAVTDGSGEWFEVYNTTGAAIDMNGWTIKDDGSNSFDIGASLMVPASGYAVLGNNGDSGTNGGVSVDYVYSGFTFGNGADEVVLECSGTEIDRVNYDDVNFPDNAGVSMSLDPTKFNATDNDDGANWCDATTAYASGDLGTPGAANDNCGCTPPVITIADQTICASENPVDLTALEPTGQENGTWLILGDPLLDPTNENVSDGITYTYTWTDPNTQCEGTGTVTFTVNTNPTVTLSDITICESENPVDLVEPTGQPNGTWSEASPYTATSGDVVSYTWVDDNGCEGTGSMTITVNSNPVVDIADQTIADTDNPFDLTSLEPTGQTGGTWSATSPLDISNGDSFTYTYTNTDGCSGSTQVTFTVTTTPTAPDCTTLLSPVNGSTDVAIDASLVWASVTGATGYTLSVGTTAGGTDIVDHEDVLGTSYSFASDFANSQTVYVSIRPYNDAGSATDCSSFSFTTESPSADPIAVYYVNTSLVNYGWMPTVTIVGCGVPPGFVGLPFTGGLHEPLTEAQFAAQNLTVTGGCAPLSYEYWDIITNSNSCDFGALRAFKVTDGCGNYHIVKQMLSYGPPALSVSQASTNSTIANYGFMSNVTGITCSGGDVNGLPLTGGNHVVLTLAQMNAQDLAISGGCNNSYEYWDIVLTGDCASGMHVLRAFRVTGDCATTTVKQHLYIDATVVTPLSLMETSTSTALTNYGWMTPVSAMCAANGSLDGLPLTNGVHHTMSPMDFAAQNLTVVGGCPPMTYEYWDITNGGSCATGMTVTRAFRVSGSCGVFTVKKKISVDAPVTVALGLIETSTGIVLNNYGWMTPITVSCAINGDVNGLPLTNGIQHALTAAEFAAQDLTVVGVCAPMTYKYWDLKMAGANCGTGMSILRAFRVSGACGTYTVKKMITVDAAAAYVGNNDFSNKAEKVVDGLSVDLSPNPATDVIRVTVLSSFEGNADLQIMNSQGSLVKTERNSLTEGFNGFTYDVSDLPSGVYFLRVINSEAQQIKRFIVR